MVYSKQERDRIFNNIQSISAGLKKAAPPKKKKEPKKKLGKVAKFKRTIRELLKGDAAYMSKAEAKKIRARTVVKKKDSTTTRTKSVQRSLKRAGVHMDIDQERMR